MSAEKVKYRLFVMKPRELSEDERGNWRFTRSNGRYTLIYTAEVPENCVEITKEEFYRLSKAERDWLRDCNGVLLLEDLANRQEEIATSLKSKIEELEKELEERSKAEKTD